jgi:argininosuccinate lyase
VSADLRRYLLRRIPRLQVGVAQVVAALLAQAESVGDGLMPAFTHLRPKRLATINRSQNEVG